MELIIDTSTRFATVGISLDGKMQREYSWFSKQNHTVEILPSIEYILKSIGSTPRDLTSIFVARGPGGFSALRVGISIAKGFSVAYGIPVVGISTLEVEAYPFIGLGSNVCPMIDIGREDMAVVLFKPNGSSYGYERLCEEHVLPLENILSLVDGPTIFCGEGSLRMDRIEYSKLNNDVIIPNQSSPTRRATSMATLGYKKLIDGNLDDISALEPVYMRGPSITLPKK
jgi:tRNA threonylcarbamoyladenosine biosynthesis protein TsaB